MRWYHLVIVFIVGLLIGAAGNGSSTTTGTTTATKTVTETTTSPLAARERSGLREIRRKARAESARLARLRSQVGDAKRTIARNTVPGTGTFVVGSDIAPGTYRAAATQGCYWARLHSLDTSDIIDNDNADGPVVVQILPSDKAFLANGCGDFHKVG